jgi:hypothetical protein
VQCEFFDVSRLIWAVDDEKAEVGAEGLQKQVRKRIMECLYSRQAEIQGDKKFATYGLLMELIGVSVFRNLNWFSEVRSTIEYF